MSAVQGKRQIGSDGKRFISADNGKANTDGETNENCCCAGSGCGSCGNISDLSATVSDIVYGACVDDFGFPHLKVIDNPNGTWDTFTFGSPCTFVKQTDVTLVEYEDVCVTPTTGVDNTDDAQISLSHDSGTNVWTLTIAASTEDAVDTFFFRGRVTAGFDESPLMFTNELTTYGENIIDGHGFFAAAHGGNVVVTFVCA